MNPATFARKSDMLDVDCLVVQARRAELRDVVEQSADNDEREVLVPKSSTESRAAFRVRGCVLIRAGRQGWVQGVPGNPMT